MNAQAKRLVDIGLAGLARTGKEEGRRQEYESRCIEPYELYDGSPKDLLFRREREQKPNLEYQRYGLLEHDDSENRSIAVGFVYGKWVRAVPQKEADANGARNRLCPKPSKLVCRYRIFGMDHERVNALHVAYEHSQDEHARKPKAPSALLCCSCALFVVHALILMQA